VVARARRCVGVRTRLLGRSAVHGLDCVGLAAFAHGLGPEMFEAAPYDLRNDNRARLLAGLARAGFAEVAYGETGDLVAYDCGRVSAHLAVLAGNTIIHADFGLRRVVETRARDDWRPLGSFRRVGED
jgi:hypothetical protein